jgi:hypothetical protein
MTVFLPDLVDAGLVSMLLKRFDDGPSIPGLIGDAYRYFGKLMKDHPKKILVMLTNTFPGYSLYKFDDVAIVALYPNSTFRQPSLSLEVALASALGEFIEKDLQKSFKEARRASCRDLMKLAGTEPTRLTQRKPPR